MDRELWPLHVLPQFEKIGAYSHEMIGSMSGTQQQSVHPILLNTIYGCSLQEECAQVMRDEKKQYISMLRAVWRIRGWTLAVWGGNLWCFGINFYIFSQNNLSEEWFFSQISTCCDIFQATLSIISRAKSPLLVNTQMPPSDFTPFSQIHHDFIVATSGRAAT